jgi:hypothetical protein
MASDICANKLYEGDLVRAWQAIWVPDLLMPGRTDLDFPVATASSRLLISNGLNCDQFRRSGDMWLINRRPVARIFFLRSAVRTWLESRVLNPGADASWTCEANAPSLVWVLPHVNS